jgi:glycosyltransferase involved in cell wall biosynthesis
MADVLMLAINDWANTGYRFYRCMKHLGLDVEAYKREPHPFMYPEQIPIHDWLKNTDDGYVVFAPRFRDKAKDAKVIHYIATTIVDPGVDLRTKNVVMQHGGRAYRYGPEMVNKVFNRVVDKTIIQCPDLLGYGANNEQWIYYPVDTDSIRPALERSGRKLVVGHFPSLPTLKGTREINEVMASVDDDRIEWVGVGGNNRGEVIDWVSNLDRVRKCDIIIETMAMEAQGRRYGEWGNTAIEAAAMGKIVITNSLTTDLYEKEFGEKPALIIANDKDALKERIEELAGLSDAEIESKREETRAWVERHHSIPATANRLWDLVYKEFFLSTATEERQNATLDRTE